MPNSKKQWKISKLWNKILNNQLKQKNINTLAKVQPWCQFHKNTHISSQWKSVLLFSRICPYESSFAVTAKFKIIMKSIQSCRFQTIKHKMVYIISLCLLKTKINQVFKFECIKCNNWILVGLRFLETPAFIRPQIYLCNKNQNHVGINYQCVIILKIDILMRNAIHIVKH